MNHKYKKNYNNYILGEKGDRGFDGLNGCKGNKGEKGMQGFQGIRGEPGLPGQMGLRGEPGPQGIPGIQGQRGEPGNYGDIGPKGDIGEKGERGIPGIEGPKGEKGEAGYNGPKGDKGDCGSFGGNSVLLDVNFKAFDANGIRTNKYKLVNSIDLSYYDYTGNCIKLWLNCIKINDFIKLFHKCDECSYSIYKVINIDNTNGLKIDLQNMIINDIEIANFGDLVLSYITASVNNKFIYQTEYSFYNYFMENQLKSNCKYWLTNYQSKDKYIYGASCPIPGIIIPHENLNLSNVVFNVTSTSNFNNEIITLKIYSYSNINNHGNPENYDYRKLDFTLTAGTKNINLSQDIIANLNFNKNILSILLETSSNIDAKINFNISLIGDIITN